MPPATRSRCWRPWHFLRGEHRAPRLLQVTRAAVRRAAADRPAGRATKPRRWRRVDAVLADGSALERFARMVAALGGPADFCERAGALPASRAGAARRCRRPQAGWVAARPPATSAWPWSNSAAAGARPATASTTGSASATWCSLGPAHRARRAAGRRACGRRTKPQRRRWRGCMQCIDIGEAAPAPMPVLIARVPAHPFPARRSP